MFRSPSQVDSGIADSIDQEPVDQSEPAAGADPAPPAGDRVPTTPSDDEDERALHGFLATRYRGRWAGSDEDHDLYQSLSLRFEHPSIEGLTGSFFGRAAWDADGNNAPDSSLFSLQDGFDSDLTGRIYHAYLDLEGAGARPDLRVGRQTLQETPLILSFDGFQFETRALGERQARIGGYGGIPVIYYESSPQGDLSFGLYGTMQPWEDATLRLDWMHLEDDNLLGAHSDDLFSIDIRQGVFAEGYTARLGGAFSALEDDGRDFELTAQYLDESADLTLDLRYYRLLDTQADLALPLDLLFAVLFELFPYHQATFLASKEWETFGIELGADLRRVDESDDVGTFNRDFDRFHATGTLRDLLPEPWTFSATAELWDSPSDRIESWGADFSRRVRRGWDASIGTYYSLFKYDFQVQEERDHVRTSYLRLGYRTGAAWRFGLRYDFERNDFDDFHRLQLETTWSF